MTAEKGVIEPFFIAIADGQLAALSDRLSKTRWSAQETVKDWSQGVPRSWLKEVCQHWEGHYDWRQVESELNDAGSFIVDVDGLNIHFLHQRSSHANAIPIVLTHGWPGSVIEFLDVIPMLTRPEAFGGSEADAFHVVIPSLPGFGFSGKPIETGWHVERIASAWAKLMEILGYKNYIAQGGDWGSEVSLKLAQMAKDDCLGAHINMVLAAVPKDVTENPSKDERIAFEVMAKMQREGTGYAAIQSTRPQTLGYGLTDSPVGQAAWILEKFYAWTDNRGDPLDAVSTDRLLDNVTLYWLTSSATSSARLYWESFDRMGRHKIEVPVACSMFPKEVFRPTRRWAANRFESIVYWNEALAGGHFAAIEQPKAFVDEVSMAAKALRN